MPCRKIHLWCFLRRQISDFIIYAFPGFRFYRDDNYFDAGRFRRACKYRHQDGKPEGRETQSIRIWRRAERGAHPNS
ncbi:hypothetical protein D9M68_445640 [compost metagenome]